MCPPSDLPETTDILNSCDAGLPSVKHQEIITRQGFDEFSRRNHLRLIRFYLSRRLRLEDAQDLAQEAFLLLWRKRRESLPPHLAFLFGIARRLYFAFLRTRKADEVSLEDDPKLDRAAADGVSEGVTEDVADDGNPAFAELLTRATGLTQNQLKVLQMRFVEGLSQRKVAEKLGLSRSSVETHERRGLESFRRAKGRRPECLKNF